MATPGNMANRLAQQRSPMDNYHERERQRVIDAAAALPSPAEREDAIKEVADTVRQDAVELADALLAEDRLKPYEVRRMDDAREQTIADHRIRLRRWNERYNGRIKFRPPKHDPRPTMPPLPPEEYEKFWALTRPTSPQQKTRTKIGANGTEAVAHVEKHEGLALDVKGNLRHYKIEKELGPSLGDGQVIAWLSDPLEDREISSKGMLWTDRRTDAERLQWEREERAGVPLADREGKPTTAYVPEHAIEHWRHLMIGATNLQPIPDVPQAP